jgi:phage shock protein A
MQERIEEMEARADEVDELDEAPDVSASDMM